MGAGAIGSWLAARLSAHHDITLLGRAERIEALQRSGLTLETLAGAAAANNPDRGRTSVRADGIHFEDVVAWRPSAAQASAPVVVAVRAYQTSEAAAMLHALGCTPTSLLTLQNGLGNAEALADVFGPDQIVAGTTSHGVTWVPPATARHAGAGDTTVGPWTDASTSSANQWAAWLSEAGITTSVTGDVRAALWTKVAINAAINPPTALYDIDNGALLDGGTLEHDLEAAAREVAIVGGKEGVGLSPDDCVEAARTVARRTAANISSMRQARRAGRPLETDAIVGEVVRRAGAHGVPVPTLTRFLVALEAL